MAISTSDIQALYIAYFNRPADFLGLQFWQDAATKAGSVAVVANEFSKSPEYTSLYAGKSTAEIIDTIYMNLFGRHAEPDGISFWGKALQSGAINIGNAAYQIFKGAQNADKVAVESKVAAAQAFYAALDTSAEIVGYSGDAANAVVKQWLSGVVDATTKDAATTADALAAVTGNAVAAHDGVFNAGKNFALTLNVDTIVGTANNDVITGAYDVAGSSHALSGLDTIDGGAGIDTLNLTDAKGGALDLSVGSVTNVEKLNITSVSTIVGNAAANSVNLKNFASGLTDAAISVKQAAGLTITAATATNLTISNNDDVTVVGGGSNVSVTSTGAVVIGNSGAATSADANKVVTATVKGATGASITDNSGTSGAVGSTLTTVNLDSITGASTLTGKGITAVKLTGLDSGADVTIANSAAHALTLTANGIDASGASIIVTDAKATTVNLVASDDSTLALAVAKATTLAVSGAADVTLDTVGSNYASLTGVTFTGAGTFTADLSGADELVSVNSSTSTGVLDITIAGTNNAAAAPAAQSVTGGAGDDKVTITGILGKGSTLSLGGGSDVVAVTGGGVITGAAVVDAGAGTDTLSLAVVDATNVGAFKNFELFDVATAVGTFDQAILDTKNTVTGFVGTAAVNAAGVTLQNLGAGVGFTVLGDMGANIVTLTQATAGALTITSDVDEAKADAGADVTAAKFVASNATSLNLVFDNANVDKLATYANSATLNVDATKAASLAITSGGSEVVNHANVNSGLASSGGGDNLKTITVTGSQDLVLDITHAGTVAVTSVDASALTGALTFNLNDLTSSGTIKLGGGDDVVTGVAITTTASTAATVQTISGLKAGTDVDASAQDGFDVIHFGTSAQSADHTAASATAYAIKDGLYTLGSGVTTLAGAVAQIAGNIGAQEAVVFNYAGTYYVYGSGALAGAGANQSDDLLVKLAGVASVTGLDNVAAGDIYIIG
jgi:hypothetical protein